MRVPTNNSLFCEVHFAPEMWQQRADGKKKLKSDAIPTIFGFFIKKQNKSIEEMDNNTQIIEFINDSKNDNVQNKEQIIIIDNSEPDISSIPCISPTMESNRSEVQIYSINNTESIELINDHLIKDVQNKEQQVCII
ncbi:PREDICTED: uncharacterized protein LOC108777575 [Cyphomyrmex costatus]|uniref:THAP-type domain-containing protein n=1 Tax=Cyphomyrmex costatus TaxID=456900 RepID=A0A151IDD5_9HYME|nr:PREDICTED: uncharacterized protein LOC108777575 [Cyphomyrmex costatus]KYM98411.1 hypothetical protein ALC62_10884 [Cyphomyrmex costatus]